MPFLVLPDHPAAATVLKRLPEATQLTVLTHHSGRPWIVGRWSAADAVCASAARNRAVIFGPTTMDVATLTARLRNVRGVRELDALAESLPGTFHLIASIDGEVRFQGSLSTARHVFHTTVDGMTVAADRPQTLAALSGAGIDEEVIALRLLSLWPPGPLIERCVWRGVQSPPMGHHLLVRPDGTAHTRQWWTPPPPEIPLAEAAPVLREALIEGVEARRRENGLLSADLSGGMDSTSLCFIAAHRDVPLFTVRFQPLDPANDDDRWASLCESELPGIDHVVIPGSQGPDWYARPRIAEGDLDGPTPFVHSEAMTEHLAKLVAHRGSSRHVQGINGDELFHASPMCLHALMRKDPLAAAGPVRATRVMKRWTMAGTARFLLSNPSYSRWLAACAHQLTAPRTRAAELEWEMTPKMPPWATREAVRLVRNLLIDTAAGDPQPLSPLPVQHAMMRVTRVNGALMRHNSTIGSAFGVSFESPYLDDRVLTAALSIRLADRMVIGRYKPVLTTAMRNIAPDTFLGRQTKGDFSAELYRGLRHQRPTLLNLCDESHLVRMGLIDPGAMRSVLLGLHANSRPLIPLDATLGCEYWLQSLPTSTKTGAPTLTTGA